MDLKTHILLLISNMIDVLNKRTESSSRFLVELCPFLYIQNFILFSLRENYTFSFQVAKSMGYNHWDYFVRHFFFGRVIINHVPQKMDSFLYLYFRIENQFLERHNLWMAPDGPLTL